MTQPILRPGFVGVDAYLNLPRAKETWLLEPLIPANGSALLYGDVKMGKSYLGIQLALALSGQAPDFLGFPVRTIGKVLYLQLDTPRVLWAKRFELMIKQGGLAYDSQTLLLADRETIEFFPFDILQPQHMTYLRAIVAIHAPTCVILDTLREAHSGDEDSSTAARNVIANLVAATSPAALVLVSHSRKPHPDVDKDLRADHRGSSYVTGRMDSIVRLTKNRLYYMGRSIEDGDIKIVRQENGLWAPVVDESIALVDKVLKDATLSTLRAKARALAPLVGSTEEAALSRLRRTLAALKLPEGKVIPFHVDTITTADGARISLTTGEEVC